MAIKKGRISRLQALGSLAAKVAGSAAIGVVDRITLGRDEALASLHRKTAEKLLGTFGEMKGLPMKMGQMLSFMDGVIPPEYQEIYRRTLQSLQIHAKPSPWKEMEATFTSELGAGPGELFAEIDRTPIAAASIGQVYRAKLLDGMEVAVKIQYPEIGEAIDSDLKNVEAIARTIRAVVPTIDNEQFSRDTIARFRDEIDYRIEAENQTLFLQSWQGVSRVVVPKPVSGLCRKRVLVTEYHSGKTFAEISSEADSEAKSAYGETLFRFVFHSILRFGLFNADPHPGNFLFQEDGRVVFLDFGSVQRYDDASRLAFQTLLRAILSGKRGGELWSIMEETLLIAPGTPEALQKLFQDHFLLTLEPVLAQQPFRYNAAYVTRVAEAGTRVKLTLARHLLTTKLKEAKREGLAPLLRILFGLNSLLATLEAERDWRSILLETERAPGGDH